MQRNFEGSNFDQGGFQGSGLRGIEPTASIWTRLVRRWYRLAAPADPPPTAPFEARDIVRRARLASVIIFIVLIGNIPSLPPALTGPNKILLPVLGVQLVATILAAVFNKRGRVTLGGLLVVLSLAIGMMANIATTPGGITVQAIPLFAILSIPEIVAAAMLPAFWVFIIAAINIAFSFFAISNMHAPNLSTQDLTFAIQDGAFLTATVQIVIAGVSFLWNMSLSRALREKDQAEEISRLERDLSEQSMELVRQKEQLEQSIGLIIQTQSRVANGDLNARVPLTQDNVLWSVAGTLNNLISRLQRLRTVEHELELTKTSANNLVTVLRSSKMGMSRMRYQRSGTVVDPIAAEVLSPNDTGYLLDNSMPPYR
ncbi:hypothetical protein [Tengunoibacter tsumagoiensis]|uniref:HAMP domain-containing protein n=1 Tax=Tengunoibacter tsumagoiensis TaxID=2014871 RepID=A0A402A3Z6_9CHLR|nr:hypothetical protein [Tengunoibacter tsumagoiensis]GCE13850.1 hypothetical protein KTT_37090 [Tengunoibacter tsumagoiensis]